MQRGQQRLKRFFSDKTKHTTPDVPRRISPEVLEFTSDVYTVPKGGTFTLKWKVKDVTSIELHKNGVFENRFNSYETQITKTAFFDIGVKSISYKLVGYKDGEQIESLPVEITLHERKLNGVQRPGPAPLNDPAIPKVNGAHVDAVNGNISLPAIFPLPSPGTEHTTGETTPHYSIEGVDPVNSNGTEPLIDANDQNGPILPNDPLPETNPLKSIDAEHTIHHLQQVDPLPVMDPLIPIDGEHSAKPEVLMDAAPVVDTEHQADNVQQIDLLTEIGPGASINAEHPAEPMVLMDPVTPVYAENQSDTVPGVNAEHPAEPVVIMAPVPKVTEHQANAVPAINAEHTAEPLPLMFPSPVVEPVSEILTPTPVDTVVPVDPLTQVEYTMDSDEAAIIINRRKSKKPYVIGVALTILALVLSGLAIWFYPRPKPEKPVTSISGVNPKYIYSLSEPVTITGKHFPANDGKVKVLLNNVPALIRSQSENSLVITFPEAADQTEWKGAIKIGVIINNDTLYTPQNVLVLKNLINTSGENEENAIPGLRKNDEPEPAVISDKEKTISN